MPNNPQKVSYKFFDSQLNSGPSFSCYVDNVEHFTFQVRGCSNNSTVAFEGSIDGPYNMPSPPNFFGLPMTDLSNSTVTTTAYHDGLYTTEVRGLHEVRANITHKSNSVPVTVVGNGL